jgi:rhodanese-related sulfurtransferase
MEREIGRSIPRDVGGFRRVTTSRTTIHQMLEDARKGLRRLTPREAFEALGRGAILVDTRTVDERRAQGVVPGSRHHPLSVLEWALDPVSGHGDPDVALDSWIVVLCQEGYSSSLAAARLQRLGFSNATDVIGGVEAWRAERLPLQPAPADPPA